MITLKKIITSILIFTLILLYPHNITTMYAEEYEEEYAEDGEWDEEATSSEETTEEIPQETKDENGFPIITCQSAIVMDAKTGQVIYEKDGYSKQYPASTTKIMTALILLEHGNMNDILTMSENAIWGIDRDSSNIGLDVGEKISMQDGLYAILMSSANEVCVAAAEHISGSTQAFVSLMNTKAQELGCTSTNFVNVNGLHDDNHYTCAYDLAIIAREALKNDSFREMSACTYYEIPPTNLINDTRYLWQNNELICETSSYYYSYCTGGKTGYTDQAGGTLVSWASYNDMELICVVMNTQPKANIFTDSIKLYDYMFYNYYHHTLLEDFEFSPEQLTNVQNVLNNYYGCENAGQLKLHAETNQRLLVNYASDPDAFGNSLTISTDRIDEGIIGTLSVHDSNLTYIQLPVYFSGYVRSDDPEAIRAAYADGSLRQIPEENAPKLAKKLALWIAIFALILLFLPIRLTAAPRQIILSIFKKNKKKKKRR